MSREQRIEGTRVVVQMLRDMAHRRGVTLDEVNWLPDPAQEAPQQSSETYTLIVTAGQKLGRQTFPREDLEDAPRSEDARKRIGTLLRGLLAALLS